MNAKLFSPIAGLFFTALLATSELRAADVMRIGIIGTDSSHAIGFTRLLNDRSHRDHVPGGRVVAAYKGGSPDVHASASRIDGFVEELKKDPGIVFHDSIEELVANVDAVMILSVDGRAHLDQARRVFPTGKPVFIDKPVAGSLRDAIRIFRLAKEHGTPCFSSSSLRYAPGYRTLKDASVGELRGVFAYGPAELEPHHPDLFWYGVHTAETLFTVMGRGCTTVVRTHAPDADVVTGTWFDGRVGTMRGTRNARSNYGLTVFGATSVLSLDARHSYQPLVAEIVKFFQTRESPVSSEETIEIFAFMEAADESKRRGGVPVSLSEVLAANQP